MLQQMQVESSERLDVAMSPSGAEVQKWSGACAEGKDKGYWQEGMGGRVWMPGPSEQVGIEAYKLFPTQGMITVEHLRLVADKMLEARCVVQSYFAVKQLLADRGIILTAPVEIIESNGDGKRERRQSLHLEYSLGAIEIFWRVC